MSETLPAQLGDGLGNRLILVEAEALSARGLDPVDAARAWCPAQEADGLLLLDAGPADREESELRIVNRDGSEGEVCLNGARVAALRSGREAGAFRMAGRRIAWRRSAPEEVELALAADTLPESLALVPVQIGARTGVAVSWWNPHCVVPTEDLDGFDLEATAAEAARAAALFPEGVNLEAVADGGPGVVRARIHERGVGETAACGSGAVAVALVAWAGLDGAPAPLEVRMPGGSLHLAVGEGGALLIRGQAALGAALQLPLPGAPE